MGTPTQTQLIKKHLVRPFLNDGTPELPKWVQIKKATEFVRAMNPVTEERDYISDEHPTTEVVDYKPSEGLSVTMYKGEPDFDMMYEMYKKRAIGSEAQKQFLCVYLFDSVTTAQPEGGKTYYYADLTDATVTIDEFNASGKSLTCTIYENGTPTKGYVEILDGQVTFTPGEMPPSA